MIEVRKATAEDIDEISRIENESFSTPWSKKSLEMEVARNPLSHYLVAVKNFHIVGYGGFWKIGDEGHIGNIAVERDSRHRGVGTLLMEKMVADAKDMGIKAMTLEVRPGNIPALKLYSSFDFYKAGVRKGYYSDTKEDGWILWKEIK